jgi:lysophospholipase L1-like esterase
LKPKTANNHQVPRAPGALDYVANVDPATLKKTLPAFIAILREKHPTTPIALISRIIYSKVTWDPKQREQHEICRDIIIDCYAKCRRRGDRNIHFIDGNALIPYGQHLAYSDAGVHPTTYGFEMMAKALAPQIEYLLNQ